VTPISFFGGWVIVFDSTVDRPARRLNGNVEVSLGHWPQAAADVNHSQVTALVHCGGVPYVTAVELTVILVTESGLLPTAARIRK